MFTILFLFLSLIFKCWWIFSSYQRIRSPTQTWESFIRSKQLSIYSIRLVPLSGLYSEEVPIGDAMTAERSMRMHCFIKTRIGRILSKKVGRFETLFPWKKYHWRWKVLICTENESPNRRLCLIFFIASVDTKYSCWFIANDNALIKWHTRDPWSLAMLSFELCLQSD